jgi:putative membrane protein
MSPHGTDLGTFDTAVLLAVLAAGALYLRGIVRLRGDEAGRRALPRWRAAALLSAWVVLVVGLAPPLAPAADVLFSVHMGQHELLMLIAPPLLVLGRPMLAGLWALPRRLRRRVARPLRRPAAGRAWRALTAPAVAFGLHALVLWLWHAVPAFELALHHDGVHLVQHASFVATATLFWWALLHGRFGVLGYGAGVLFVFATTLHSGALGALLAVAPRPWYPTHATRAGAAGVDPLEDQQLGGLLMWIPAGAVLLVLGLALFAAWLGESGRRVRHRAAARGVLALALALGTASESHALPGDAARGRAAVVAYGCPVCHRIPGVPSARSRVGPPLDGMAVRSTIAGRFPNSADALVRWIRHPQAIDPGNVMPDMHVTDEDARDIAAFLLELR